MGVVIPLLVMRPWLLLPRSLPLRCQRCHTAPSPPQAGERLKAMRCLVRSGDTEKIILYASERAHASHLLAVRRNSDRPT